MAYFRYLEGLPQRIDDALDDDVDPEHDFPLYLGEVTQTMLSEIVRVTGDIDCAWWFIDVTAPDTHKVLMGHYGASILTELGIDRIDEGSFLTRDRAITRRIVGELDHLTTPPVAGLRFVSAHDTSEECSAIWERGRSAIIKAIPGPLGVTTPDVIRAADRLG
jgi:hypothetical protein